MPEPHQFRKLVDSTGLLERKRHWELETGTEWPHSVAEAWAWSVRDIVAGRDVASGHAPTYPEADRRAQAALEQAEDQEAERLAAELAG